MLYLEDLAASTTAFLERRTIMTAPIMAVMPTRPARPSCAGPVWGSGVLLDPPVVAIAPGVWLGLGLGDFEGVGVLDGVGVLVGVGAGVGVVEPPPWMLLAFGD